MKVKEIGYAYPSSETAYNLGFNMEGCWYLCFPGTGEPKQAFRTREEAYEVAEESYPSIPFGPWDTRETENRL